ncbi:rab GTPase-activating protein 1-like isoform X2 [Centruroides vittatus]
MKEITQLKDKNRNEDSNLSEETADSSLTACMYTSSPSPLEEGTLSRSSSSDGLCTLFNRITYLGSASINAPRDQNEIQKNIAILNEQSSEHAIEITLSIPNHSEGSVILYEPNSVCEIASFAICQILFCAPGLQNSKECHCFAFTHSHGATAESAIFQCHVFKCDVPEAVSKVLLCLAAAFRRVPKLQSCKADSVCSENTSPSKENEITCIFETTLDIKEEDSKGNFVCCPKEKDYFKFHCTKEKTVTITVQQICNNEELIIERCFGLLISPGRNVKQSDMQLLEMVSFNKSSVGSKTVTQFTGHWNPNEPPFEVLNKETPKDTRVYMTVAADLVIEGISEPVRFVIETKAKILPQNERFWYFNKKAHIEQFYLKLKEVEVNAGGDYAYNVVHLYNASQLQRKRASLKLNLKKSHKLDEKSSENAEKESDSDNDEPLLSGTGEVSKDCTEGELEGWAEVLNKWRQNLKHRPKQLASLVQKGIPEALRGEVWQLLARCYNDHEAVEMYQKLITQNSSCENAVQRDINRTFPAHEFFKENGGAGQEALYRICKAYSVYDKEIGYCQGLSFLVAALLLHMPEEQAFNVTMKIMFDYHLRDLFRDSFAELHLKFYQLERLMEDQMPDLYNHFGNLGIEAHMFGSQWFLTLFTAKFPLNVVFYILDLFLLNEMDTIFQVSLALLMLSKKELLTLDFEGVLKHFRVTLPKKYRSEESAQYLLRTAVGVKIKKLKKYEKEYFILKEQEKLREDPLERLKNENKFLRESNIRLEQENDDLAHELLSCKISLHNDLDIAEDKAEALNNELLTAKTSLIDAEDEKKRLEEEVIQLKEMCRRELERTEDEIIRCNAIIADYKQICSQLSKRLEKEQTSGRETVETVMECVKTCEKCCKQLEERNVIRTGGKLKKMDAEDKLSTVQELEDHVKELELELAQTKLALVESECKNQDLTHQLNGAVAELQASKNTWLHKTLSSIRDATRKEPPGGRENKD